MSRTLIKFIRLSSTKARLIVREVQGINTELAMTSLRFTPNKGTRHIASTISSAVANGGFETNRIMVRSCHVDAGTVLKRFRPRVRRSISRIRRPTLHILVGIARTEIKTEAKKAITRKTSVRKTNTKKVAAEKES